MNAKSGIRRFKLFAAVVAAATLACSAGCVAMGTGGPVAYVRGDLDATLNVTFENALRAVNAAVEQLEFQKVSEKKDASRAIVISRNPADKRIEIRIEKIAESATNLKIRVGTFGDETVAMATYVKINANL